MIKCKPRICAVGIISQEVPEQIVDLMRLFSKNGIESFVTTKKNNKVYQLYDIIRSLLLKKNNYDVIHVQAHSYKNIFILAVAILGSKILNKKIVVMYYGGAAPSFFQSILD